MSSGTCYYRCWPRQKPTANACCYVPVSNLAQRYVTRGLESGGAAGDLGRYVTFAQPDGRPIEYLHPVESIGVNGLHAVIAAPVLVRTEMLRKERTYELLITQHRPSEPIDGQATCPRNKDVVSRCSRAIGVGPVRKGQEPSGRRGADVLLSGRRGSKHPEAVSGSVPRRHQGGELCWLLAFVTLSGHPGSKQWGTHPTNQRAEITRKNCHERTWREGKGRQHARKTEALRSCDLPVRCLGPFRPPLRRRRMPMVAIPVGALEELIQMGDAPACNICGSLMVRSGTCYRCMTCGSTSACSW